MSSHPAPELGVGPVTRKDLISKKEDVQVNALRCAGKSSIKDFSAILFHPQLSLETSQVQNHCNNSPFPTKRRTSFNMKPKLRNSAQDMNISPN